MKNQLIPNIFETQKFFCKSMAVGLYEKNGVFGWITKLNNKYLKVNLVLGLIT